MIETYADELREFANFYFKNMFKGLVIVEAMYEPRSMSSRIVIKIKYNDVYTADASQPIEDYTSTMNVMDIFEKLARSLKAQYDSKLSEKENIFK